MWDLEDHGTTEEVSFYEEKNSQRVHAQPEGRLGGYPMGAQEVKGTGHLSHWEEKGDGERRVMRTSFIFCLELTCFCSSGLYSEHVLRLLFTPRNKSSISQSQYGDTVEGVECLCGMHSIASIA